MYRRGQMIRSIDLLGVFCLSRSALSLSGYMIYGGSRRYLLTVLRISFTLGSLALVISVFLANFPG